MKCSKCHIKEGRGKENLCRQCWRREYTKKNKKHISQVAQKKYIRNRAKTLNQIRAWQERNKDKIAKDKREYYKRHSEEFKTRQLTRTYFGDLKKTSKCEMCSSRKKLEFQHEKPYRYDVFKILCFDCHRALHGQLFTEEQLHQYAKPADHYSLVELNETESKNA